MTTLRPLALLLIFGACDTAPEAQTAGPPTPGLEVDAGDYADARAHSRTRLIRHGSSPHPGGPPRTPPGSVATTYDSSGRSLVAFITPDPGDRRRRPAVLFLHGGFSFGEQHWDMTSPYREAGFIVMLPILRGENGQGGDFSLFYDEVDDVLAAAERLAGLPYVEAGSIYLAGHSVGGTLAMLAAMASPRFRAAASFSGSPDQVLYVRGRPEIVPFEPSDIQEFRLRSPVAHAGSFKCPTRLYFGDDEYWLHGGTARTASLAKGKGLDVEAIEVPGDHDGMVPEAIERSIRFFRGGRDR
jgi:dipeptidyl aminopeptidase/acylaminoacyl peptidase